MTETTPTEKAKTRRITRMRRVRYLHPFAFALSPLLALYAINQAEVTPAEVVRPALLLLLLTAILAPVFYLAARRNAARAALALSGAFLVAFAFDQFSRFTPWVRRDVVVFIPGPGGLYVPFAVAVLWALTLIVVTVLTLRTRRDYTAAAWIAAAVLIVPDAGRILTGRVPNAVPAPVATATPAPSTPAQPALPPTSAPPTLAKDLPDLYVIVLDAYGREDTLRSQFGIDNQPFVHALTTRGFTVAPHSHANYIQTVLALAAALNLEYLTPNKHASLDSISPMIDHNAVAALLRERGFRFVDIPSDFPLTRADSADLVLDSETEANERVTKAMASPSAVRHPLTASFPAPFEALLLNKTPATLIPHRDDSLYALHRESVLGALDYLNVAAAQTYPKFVFAHILLPHPPFVFGPEGEARYPDRPYTLGDATDYGGDGASYRDGYAAQLRFVNRRILAAVDYIQAHSHRPAAILLMGDHGSRSHTDWHSQQRTDLYEAFGNLLAVACPPGHDPNAHHNLETHLNQDISPINALRLLLNDAYGTTYSVLPERSFYSILDQPRDFQEVTAEARRTPNAAKTLPIAAKR